MCDLVEFLTARLDECWSDAQEDHTLGCGTRDDALYDDANNLASFDETWREHCDCRARKRLLNVEADRKLTAAFESAAEWYDRPENGRHPAGEVTGLCTAVKIRAERFADHADYDESWRL